jgi:hypothetical protein
MKLDGTGTSYRLGLLAPHQVFLHLRHVALVAQMRARVPVGRHHSVRHVQTVRAVTRGQHKVEELPLGEGRHNQHHVVLRHPPAPRAGFRRVVLGMPAELAALQRRKKLLSLIFAVVLGQVW